MRILYINTFDPFDEIHGGALLARAELAALKTLFEVDVIYGTPIRRRLKSVSSLKCAMEIFKGHSVKAYLHSDIQRSAQLYSRYDLVYCCHDFTAYDYKLFGEVGVPYLVRKLNSEYRVLRPLFRLIPGETKRVKNFEEKVCEHALQVLHVSSTEYEEDNYSSNKKWLLPPLVPNHEIIEHNTGDLETRDILMVSNFNWWPNLEGIRWFLNKVWPKLANKGYNLTIAGPGSKNLDRLKGVSYLGYVQDLNSLYLSSKLVICPILSGAGIKMKILEAVIHGKQIVTTAKGIDGLGGLSNCSNIKLGDTPVKFAEQIEVSLQNHRRRTNPTDAQIWLKKHMLEPEVWARQLENIQTNSKLIK